MNTSGRSNPPQSGRELGTLEYLTRSNKRNKANLSRLKTRLDLLLRTLELGDVLSAAHQSTHMTLGITDRKASAQNPGGRTIRPNHSALEIIDGLSANQAPDEILHLSTIILVNAFQIKTRARHKNFQECSPRSFRRRD